MFRVAHPALGLCLLVAQVGGAGAAPVIDPFIERTAAYYARGFQCAVRRQDAYAAYAWATEQTKMHAQAQRQSDKRAFAFALDYGMKLIGQDVRKLIDADCAQYPEMPNR